MLQTVCPLCGKEAGELVRQVEAEVRASFVVAVQEKNPQWTLRNGTCPPCMNIYLRLMRKPKTGQKIERRLQDRVVRRHHPGEDV